MKLCLHLEGDLQLYNPAWLWRHADQLHSGALELAGRLGFFPHIAVHLQMLREQWDAEQAEWPKLSLRLTAVNAMPAVPAVPPRRLKGKGDPSPSSAQTKRARHQPQPRSSALQRQPRTVLQQGCQAVEAVPMSPCREPSLQQKQKTVKLQRCPDLPQPSSRR